MLITREHRMRMARDRYKKLRFWQGCLFDEGGRGQLRGAERVSKFLKDKGIMPSTLEKVETVRLRDGAAVVTVWYWDPEEGETNEP